MTEGNTLGPPPRSKSHRPPPHRIIVYHDGVSEAQKGLVQEFEIDHGIRSSRA
jgi:hypothetical protein